MFDVSCRDKINELHDWMCQLESEKFDHMEKLKLQKYEVRTRLWSLTSDPLHTWWSRTWIVPDNNWLFKNFITNSFFPELWLVFTFYLLKYWNGITDHWSFFSFGRKKTSSVKNISVSWNLTDLILTHDSNHTIIYADFFIHTTFLEKEK